MYVAANTQWNQPHRGGIFASMPLLRSFGCFHCYNYTVSLGLGTARLSEWNDRCCYGVGLYFTSSRDPSVWQRSNW